MTRSTSPVVLAKTELIGRLAKRAGRYNVVIAERLVDRWIEQALLAAGERRGNVGRKPRYEYGARHYRRALQIARLYGKGLKDRDAVFVQLFVRGYGVAPHEVRDPLRIEYRKAVAKMLAAVRSIYAERWGDIPPDSKRALHKQMGPIDPRLAASGFQLSADDMTEVVRRALDPADAPRSLSPPTTASPGLGAFLPMIWPVIGEHVAGVLALDKEFPNRVETALGGASEAYIKRSVIALDATRILFRMFDGFPGLEMAGGHYRAVPGRIAQSLLEREFCAFALAILIYLFVNNQQIAVTPAA